MMGMFNTVIKRKIRTMQYVEFITLPICSDCRHSKYPALIWHPPICIALGNKPTSDVFNSKECRSVFKDEKEPWKRLND